MTPCQLLAYRAIFSTAINGLSINVNAYEVLWKSIPTGCGFSLFFRVLQQNVSTFITFYTIRQFDLTTVSLVNGTATFVIFILGILMLGEKFSLFTFAALSTSFIGTLLLLFGAQQPETLQEGDQAQ